MVAAGAAALPWLPAPVAWAQSGPTPAAADLLLRNGRVVTMDAAGRVADAVAVRGERIVALGREAEAMAGPQTRVVDLGGRTVVPGLIDSHLHQHFAALNAPHVQLLGARSIADVARLVGERVRATPPGEWVQASSGWHESLLAEGRLPTRWELDAVSPEHPVFIPRGGHVVAVNSRALERAGISRDTPQPQGGVIVKREGDGEPTGVLLIAGATGLVRRVLPPPPPPDEQARLLRDAMRELNGHGLVAVVEPGIDDRIAAVYRQNRDAGGATVRTHLLWRASTRDQAARGLASVRDFPNDRWLRAAGIKIPLDGGVEGGRMREPYRLVPGEQTDPAYRGVLLMPPGGADELDGMLRLAAAARAQVQTHAVGDETIDVIVDAYGRVNAETPVRPLRWAVMHVFLPGERAMRRMAEMGVMATAQDHPVLLGHNQRRWWGDERAARAIPIRALLDAGVRVGGGTDGPVVPVDPFLSMWWMVTRGTLNGDRLGPEQGITPLEALRLYTRDNAALMGVDDEQGSVEPGKLADLAVLSQDILSVPPDRIRDTRAVMTVVGGRIVHRAGGL